MFLELSDVRDENEIGFSATIRTEDGDPVGPTDSRAARYIIYKGHFDDHVQRDPERERRDHWLKKGLIEAVWGYAITCHKAQGSQWESVIVLRRRSRSYRPGSRPLAVHRDHPCRAGARDP